MFTFCAPGTRVPSALLFLLSIVVSGCVAHAPPAQVAHETPTVERPPLDNDDVAAWRNYYEDQIRMHAADTAEPTASYPVNAREAYRLEMQKWAMQQIALANRELEEPFYGVLGVILLGLAGYGGYALVTGD